MARNDCAQQTKRNITVSKSQKVLALHSSSELYGADRIFAQTLKFLTEGGFSIDAYLPREGPLLSHIKSHKKTKVQVWGHFPIAVRSAFGPRNLFSFLRKCISSYSFLLKRKKDFDHLYINTMSLFAFALLGKLAGYKNIIIHSHEIISHHGFLPRLMNIVALACSTKIICVSDAVKKDLIGSTRGRFKNKLMVVHNGVADPGSKGKPKKQSGDSKIKFLLVGRIMPEKGQWFILESLPLLKKEILENLSFTFIGGSAPNREHLIDDLKSKILGNGLSDIIEIIEFTTDLNDIYPNFDVCVIPSIMPDPFPTTVLEAMSHGKPVIVTNHGGAAEIVENGVSGILVTPGDSTQLSGAIEMYVTAPELINTHGQNGYSFFKKNLTLNCFQERFLSAFCPNHQN